MLNLHFALGSIVELGTDFGRDYSGKVVAADNNSVTIVHQQLLSTMVEDDHYGIRHGGTPGELLSKEFTMDYGPSITIDRTRIVSWNYFSIQTNNKDTVYFGLPQKSEWEDSARLNRFDTYINGLKVCIGDGEYIDP